MSLRMAEDHPSGVELDQPQRDGPQTLTVDRDELERECHVFAWRVARVQPSAYVVDRYVAAHRQGHVGSPATPADRMLANVARRGGPWTALADAYARIVRPAGTLRRKLVLFAAILECTSPAYRAFESPPPASAMRVIARLAVRGGAFALLLTVALLVLGPVHLAVAAMSGRRAITRAAEARP
jgi:hypothetical protein